MRSSLILSRKFSTFPKEALLPEKVVFQRVVDTIKSVRPTSLSITELSAFAPDLGFDSLRKKELIQAFEHEFCVSFKPSVSDSFITVKDIVSHLASHPKAR
jgi:acyl carrier protein